jgi:hypothetical protein
VLKRSKPLQRKTRLRARRQKPRRGPIRDQAYKALVRSLPCLLSTVEDAGQCSGRVDPDHLGKPGEAKRAGQQADDTTCVPMCRGHHGARTNHTGYFAGRTDEDRERWRRWALGKTAILVATKRRANLANTRADIEQRRAVNPLKPLVSN